MTTAPSLQSILDVALDAGNKAAAIAREHREQFNFSVSFKGSRDLVTSADVACEKSIKETIRSHFPDHTILAEESTQDRSPKEYGTGYVWIIDPIDGTTNYAHGHPHVGISIACALNGSVIVGVVVAPFLNETFTATKGEGAFLNGNKITCTSTDTIEGMLVTTGFPYSRDNIKNICGRIERVASQCRDIRRLGAASLDLCWVACGRLDAYFEETLRPWDGAAGGLIAKEAGAVIGHYNYDHETQHLTQEYPGDLYVDNIVATNPVLLPKLLAILNQS